MILYTSKHLVPFQIDEEDYFAVSQYYWNIGSDGYIQTTIRCFDGKNRQHSLSLHQFIMGRAPDGLVWDHFNRDKTDNRRGNFRAVQHHVNKRNEDAPANNTSGVRGVSRFSSDDRDQWQAQIRYGQGRRMHLGVFDTFEEAVEARRRAEINLWGKDR